MVNKEGLRGRSSQSNERQNFAVWDICGFCSFFRILKSHILGSIGDETVQDIWYQLGSFLRINYGEYLTSSGSTTSSLLLMVPY